jgi:hypothetical protein
MAPHVTPVMNPDAEQLPDEGLQVVRRATPLFRGWLFVILTCTGPPAYPTETTGALRIVEPANPADPIRFAAKELVRYLSALGNSSGRSDGLH